MSFLLEFAASCWATCRRAWPIWSACTGATNASWPNIWPLRRVSHFGCSHSLGGCPCLSLPAVRSEWLCYAVLLCYTMAAPLAVFPCENPLRAELCRCSGGDLRDDNQFAWLQWETLQRVATAPVLSQDGVHSSAKLAASQVGLKI